MTNYVKINYSGKDYIGQINSIESEWSGGWSLGDNKHHTYLAYYKVSLYEKDTNCLIDNIFINNIHEIEILTNSTGCDKAEAR